MNDEEKRELLEALTDHECTLVQLGALIESHRLQYPNPDLLVMPYIQKNDVELRLMKIRDKKRKLLSGTK